MNSFKIATYNIWKNEGDFPERIFKIPDTIKDMQIVCLQEDYHDKTFSSSDTINKNLNLNKITTPTRQKLRDNKISSSNLTVLSSYSIELLDEIYFNKNNAQRACQICQIKIDDKNIILANTHLCHISSKNREEQIKTILKKLDNYKADIFLFCGDLNANQHTKEIKQIKETFQSQNIQSTYNDGTILDYIFIKSDINLNIKSSVLFNTFSDHYCLINEIWLKE